MQGKPTNSSDRGGTRERLIVAAIELMRTEGASGVTTQRMANAVGIVQSGFYRHFSNADECLLESAETAARTLRQAVAENRQQHRLAEEDDPNSLVIHLETMFDMCRRNWDFVELVLTYRHQKSDFGHILASAWRAMEQDVANHFRVVAQRRGMTVKPDRLQRLAISVHAIVMRVGERERNKTAADRRVAAEQAATIIEAMFRAEEYAASSD